MKISIQWISAAILVILLLLVGAYALSNGANAPATNATATPTTTITPTPVAPSTTPTAVPPSPAPVLTPPGANGVMNTGFGYNITYPPFASYDINVNPNYRTGPTLTSSWDTSPPPSPTDNTVSFVYGQTTMTMHTETINTFTDLVRTGNLSKPLDIKVVSEDTTGIITLGNSIVHFNAGDSSGTLDFAVSPIVNEWKEPRSFTYKIDIISGAGYAIGSIGTYTLHVTQEPYSET